MIKLTCPKCKAVLKTEKQIREGMNITCPKCATKFPARPTPARPSLTKGGNKGGAADGKKEPLPPKQGPTKQGQEDSQDSIKMYTVVKDDMAGEDKEEDVEDPVLRFLRDLKPRDIRGPAQQAVIAPSNIMMLAGLAACIICVGMVMVQVWPMVFTTQETKDEPTPRELAAAARKGPTEADKKPESPARDMDRWLIIGASILAFLYFGVVIVGAIKMQHLDSYRWAMTASVMGIVLLVGLLGVFTLRRKEVITGFNFKGQYEGEE